MSQKRQYSNLLKKIKEERLKKKIKQIDLGTALNINQASYAQIENGETALTLDRLFLICEKLELDMFQLLRKDFQDDGYNKRTDLFFQVERYRQNEKERFRNIENQIRLIDEKLNYLLSNTETDIESFKKSFSEIMVSLDGLRKAIDFYKLSEKLENEMLKKD